MMETPSMILFSHDYDCQGHRNNQSDNCLICDIHSSLLVFIVTPRNITKNLPKSNITQNNIHNVSTPGMLID